MHWTLYVLILYALLACAGYIARIRTIKKYEQKDSAFEWGSHNGEQFFIDFSSNFYCRMRARVGSVGWLLLIFGLGFLLPGWLSWLGPALIWLFDLTGLVLLLVALLKMHIWPWSPAWLQIHSIISSVIIQNADGRYLWDSNMGASISGHWNEISVLCERYLGVGEPRKDRTYSIKPQDLNRVTFYPALRYLKQSGYEVDSFNLKEEL
jgi:hypothetical protein